MSVTEKPRSTGSLSAPMPAPPVRQFSFTDWQVNNPTAPPPGDRLDSEFDQSNNAIDDVIDWASVSLNTDGSIRDGVIGENNLQPDLFDDVANDAIAQVQPLVDQASVYANVAAASATDADNSASNAASSASIASGAAATASTFSASASAAAGSALSSQNAAAVSATSASNSENDAEGAAALAQDYAVVTQAWAEHMPDPIPPDILSVMGVTGNHWSSRWWAAQAASLVATVTSGQPYLALAGGIMIGPLVLARDPSGNLEAATKQYVDGLTLGATIGVDPSQSTTGPLWWDTNSGQLFIQYDDGNSVQWVPANSTTDAEAGGTGEIDLKDWGALGDGSDCTDLLNEALATGRNVYIPSGSYKIAKQIMVGVLGTTAQCLRGAGKSTLLWVDDTFDPTASSIFLMHGAEQCGVTITDLWIRCIQGTAVNNRATFKTLADGGTVYTGVMYPPVILWGNGCNRFRLERLQITNCWDGIQQVHNSSSGGWWIRDIEMSCYHIGLLVSTTLDFTHLHGWHHWVFDMSVPNRSAWGDGQTVCMQFGQGDDFVQSLNISEVNCFEGRIIINSPQGDFMFSNMMMDGSNSVIDHVNSFFTQITQVYLTCSQPPQPTSGLSQVTMRGGRLFFENIFAWAPVPVINMLGGTLQVRGGDMQTTLAGNPIVMQTNGLLQIEGVNFLFVSGDYPQGLVVCDGGSIQFRGNHFATPPAGAAPLGALVLAADSYNHVVTDNAWNGWDWLPPPWPATGGILGYYGMNSDLVMVTGRFRDGFGVGANDHPGGLNITFNSLPGAQRLLVYYTADVLLWAFGVQNNAAQNMVLLRADDSGVLQPSTTTFYRDGTTQLCRTGLVVNWDVDYPKMQPSSGGWAAIRSESNSASPLWQMTAAGDGLVTTIVQRFGRGAHVDTGGPSMPAAVQAGDQLGNLAFRGYDGAAWSTHGSLIRATAAANWSTSAHPTTLNFYTSDTLSGVLAMQIDRKGNLVSPTLPVTTTYANDAAAAAGGVVVGQLYRNGSAVQVRVS